MKNLLLIVFTVCLSNAMAQIEPVSFEEKEYDFGAIKEEDGPVTHEFVFKNGMDAPVKILNVRASCGCTTPGWSREEVGPGKTGFVKAQYNPYNRPGPFNKTLTVQTSANQSIVLRIKGNVQPKVKTLEEQFPTVKGNLRFKTPSFNLGKATPNAPVVREFDILNDGNDPVKFMENVDAPDYIQISFSPIEIQPKEQGKIIVTYDAARKNDMGFLIEDFSFLTNESENSKKDFKLYVTIDPYIPPMTQQERLEAPRLEIEKDMMDFGSIKEGEKVELEYVLKNSGKSDLDILMAKATCSCTIVSLPKNSLKPGEEMKMKVVFDATGIRGTQQKYLTVFSNDPSGPAKRLIVKGVIN